MPGRLLIFPSPATHLPPGIDWANEGNRRRFSVNFYADLLAYLNVRVIVNLDVHAPTHVVTEHRAVYASKGIRYLAVGDLLLVRTAKTPASPFAKPSPTSTVMSSTLQSLACASPIQTQDSSRLGADLKAESFKGPLSLQALEKMLCAAREVEKETGGIIAVHGPSNHDFQDAHHCALQPCCPPEAFHTQLCAYLPGTSFTTR